MVDLSRTRVVIRRREIGELYDLALAVIRRDGWSLVRWWLVAAIPYLAFAQGIVSLFFRAVWQEEPDASVVLYAFLFSAASPSLFSVLGGLITTHLGMSVFIKRPTFREVWQVWWSRLGLLLFSQIIPFSLGGLALPEIILLERLSPMTREGRAAIRRRLKTLASYGLSANQMGGFFAFLTALVTGLVMGGILSSLSAFEVPWNWGWTLLAFQFGLCLAGGFNRVVRFFIYLNSRIRFEGWDVELATRAAALRLSHTIGETSSQKTPGKLPAKPR